MFARFLRFLTGKNPAKLQTVFSLPGRRDAYQAAVAGTFNNWSCFNHPLRLSPSGVWETSIPLMPGIYRYRFILNNKEWVLDPLAEKAVNEFGGSDSVLYVREREAVRIPDNELAEQLA